MTMKLLDKKSATPSIDVQGEISRIQARIEEASRQLLDAELEFGESVRLSVELRELEAYIRGVLFATGRGSAWD